EGTANSSTAEAPSGPSTSSMTGRPNQWAPRVAQRLMARHAPRLARSHSRGRGEGVVARRACRRAIRDDMTRRGQTTRARQSAQAARVRPTKLNGLLVQKY